jgi:hypothetical protein
MVASDILVFQVQNAERLHDPFGAAAVGAALADTVAAMGAHAGRLQGRRHVVPSPPSVMPGRCWRNFGCLPIRIRTNPPTHRINPGISRGLGSSTEWQTKCQSSCRACSDHG